MIPFILTGMSRYCGFHFHCLPPMPARFPAGRGADEAQGFFVQFKTDTTHYVHQFDGTVLHDNELHDDASPDTVPVYCFGITQVDTDELHQPHHVAIRELRYLLYHFVNAVGTIVLIPIRIYKVSVFIASIRMALSRSVSLSVRQNSVIIIKGLLHRPMETLQKKRQRPGLLQG